jgi:signal transduction histidine kinase
MLRGPRRLLERLGVPWQDAVLTLGLVLAGLVWAAQAAHSHTDGPYLTPLPEKIVGPPPEKLVGPFPSGEATSVELDGDDPAYLINVLAALPLVVRRRLPYLAFTASLGSALVLRSGLTWPGFLAVVICAYSVAAYGRRLSVAFTLLGLGALAAVQRFSDAIPPIPGWAGPFAILAPVGLAAATIRTTRARADAAARRAAALEQEQAATARAAIAEERARIARELHDVVSHHVSVMVVQAGAAGKVIERRPDLAAGALAAIESSGREAMRELRQLLGLVTPAEDRLHPQPGLADLDTLVESVRAAGQPVTLRRDPVRLSPGVDLTAYRVVQEGLTNALRYAPGAPTTVEIARDGAELLVEVRNEPAGAPVTGRVGAGSGLVGLAERLRLHDGRLDAGPRLGGGYRLAARLPVPDFAVARLAGEVA